ncbi:MAG: YdbH domain-containing protein [Opitutae bacterium]
MPRFLEISIGDWLADVNAELRTISVDQINPWALRVSRISAFSNEGNVSLNQLDVRYDPVGLTGGKVHAISLTSPRVQIDLSDLSKRLRSFEPDEESLSTIQSQAEQFLTNPPLQHFRLRDASIHLANHDQKLLTKLGMEGDFHPGLAQLRMDGNLSGLPWFGDLTMVKEGTDLFLGSSLHFPEISPLSQTVSAISAILNQDRELDLSEWVQIDQGTAKGKWTGRVEEDGIMDQFMDFNVSNLVLQSMGLTLNIPQAILFVTPRTPTWIESNFYANLNWGENLDLQGLKISANVEDGKPSLTFRVQRLRAQGVLPKAEIVGLTVDGVEFAFGEEGEFIGMHKARVRFAALHLEEGVFNLYDGELSIEWLGEDRFQIKLVRANGSLPTLGINLHNLEYSGEICLDSLPKLESDQSISIEEAFLGEDQKIEDLEIDFKIESLERFEVSRVNMRVNDFEFSLDPANLVIEMPDATQGRVDISFLESELSFPEYEDFICKNIQGYIKMNTLDPLDSNGTQSIRFDFHAAEQVLQDGEIRFELLPSGEKIIETIELQALGGIIALERTMIGDDLENLQLHVLANGIESQEVLSLFEDLDARMDGNLSGILSIRNDPQTGWDFFGGALSLDSSDSAKLYLNTQGILTDGLEPKSSEYKNMYLLERALQDLNLDGLNLIFKVTEDGERLLEMNVRGGAEVDGKGISVEYRPKIIGGLNALLQQANLSKWGISP